MQHAVIVSQDRWNALPFALGESVADTLAGHGYSITDRHGHDVADHRAYLIAAVRAAMATIRPER